VIDIVIPTYGRAHRLADVAANVHANTQSPHRLVFVIELADDDSIHVVGDLSRADDRNVGIAGECGSYSKAMNMAYKHLDGEWLFAGADDLDFTPGWEWEILRREDRDRWFGVYGTNDLINPYVVAGTHATHYLIARWYLDEHGGTVDGGPGSFMHEGYDHQYCDTEFVGTAKARARFRPVLSSVVRHLHWSVGLTPRDATSDKTHARLAEDSALYDSRRHLWQDLSR